MIADFKYNPDIPEPFRCRALPGMHRVAVTNGALTVNSFSLGGDHLSIRRTEKQGFALEVKSGIKIADCMQIISVRDDSGEEDIGFANSLTFGSHSGSHLLLCNHTLTINKFHTEEEVSINMAKGAKADIVIMQNEHNGSEHRIDFKVAIEADARLKIIIVTLHGALLENNLDISLKGESANCELYGAYLMDGSQKITTNTIVSHLVPCSSSNQLFKGILDNEASATFTGKIVVAGNAQKTQAYQANHNLLVSPAAKVYTRPQLEIYADDVKCSHGATTGRLDEMALFYMRSRGIGEAEARLLQHQAFVYDVLEKIENDPLRQRLQDIVESRLRGEFAHCSDCSLHCC